MILLQLYLFLNSLMEQQFILHQKFTNFTRNGINKEEAINWKEATILFLAILYNSFSGDIFALGLICI